MKLTRGGELLVNAHAMGASFTSQAYEILEIDVEAIQVNYSGSPVGTFKVQGSVDYKENYLPDGTVQVLAAGNWADLPFVVAGVVVTSVAVPGNASPIIFDMGDSGIPFIRLVYTFTSGSGTFSAFVSGKRLGD